MKRSLRNLAVVAAFIVAPVQACDYCLMNQGISPLQTQTGSGLRVAYRYTRLNSVYKGSNEVDNPGVREEYETTELSGFTALTDRFMALVTVPIRKTDGDGELVEGPTGDLEREDSTGGADGLGDVSLLGRYTLQSTHTLDSTTLFAAVLGIKLPTGSTNQHNDQGEYLDSHLQPGTGSTDVLFGFSASHAVGRFALSANLLASFAGEGEAGSDRHQFGNSVNYDVTGKYRIAPGVAGESANALFLSLGLNGESRAKEKLNGDEVPDSGGHTLFITPGVQYTVGSRWVLEATWQYAFYQHLNAAQLGDDYRLSGAVTWLF